MTSGELSIREKPNYYATEHFLYSDFVCPCCDAVKIIPAFYRHTAMLEHMRVQLGFPIIINSGYRCTKHNSEVGGAAHSWHLLFATDIRPGDNDPEKLRALAALAEEMGFGGIGRYDTFIHLDLRPERSRWRG
ncbi:MAG: D-Ala-D-Ala carboxypeptidase family metallohydrolase [Candidatus Latescibacterota bacterium]